MNKNKILIVEDEKNFGNLLRDYLLLNDYDVVLVDNGEKGISEITSNCFDLCILDVMMPKKDGYSLAKEIRKLKHPPLFIFLSARQQKEDIVKGFHLGAQDYLIKPFDTEILLLKIKVLLNRGEYLSFQDVDIFEIAEYHFDYSLRKLQYKSECSIQLSPKESYLLKLLCLHQNNVLKREYALKTIWKEDTYFTARSMDVYIVKLRKYLNQSRRIEIKNIHGDGYSLFVKA